MEAFLFYIGKAALAAGAFYLVYLALFQHQKQFVFNRIYLPVSLAVSFLIPLITFTTVKYIGATQTFNPNSFAFLPEAMEETQPEFAYQWYHYLFGIYILGIIVFLSHLLLGHFKAFAIIRYSRLKELFGAQVNLTQKDVHPFSFFDKIVLSEKTLDNPNLEVIVNHEMIHVKEKHTHDILFAEILFLLQWFNPFAWLIKDAIRDNLEYKTDHQITKNNNAEVYQLAMVGLAHKKGVAPFLTALNGSQLKNRIIMMKKKTENRYSLLKQLVVLPLLAVLVMGLSNKEVKTEIVQPKADVKIILDGEVVSSDLPVLKSIDFSEGFNGSDIISALNLTEKVALSYLKINDDNHNVEFIIRTKDFKPEKNQEFDKITSPAQSIRQEEKSSMSYYAVDGKIVSQKEFEKQGEKGFDNVVLLSEKDATNKYGKEYSGIITNATTGSSKFVIKKEHVVRGKVTNEKGEPLAAASVIIKDKSIGTITAMNGNFEIQSDSPITRIEVFMVGYIKKEIKPDGDPNMIIKLEASAKQRNTQSSDITFIKRFNVKGKVTDENGKPISAASIVIKGKNTGTITDDNGDYSLVLGSQNEILLFTKQGYQNKKEMIYGNEVNVVLKTDGDKTTGNNTQPKEPATIKYLPNSYNPGSAAKPLSLTTNKDNPPLFVVDGIENKSIDWLNPDNIEKITALKDKQAEILYGEKAKNGAIIITTKDAAKEKLRNAVVIVNGEKYKGDISDIDPGSIEKMDVLKNESATKLYGTEAKDGAIIITTKNKLDFGDKSPLIFVDGLLYNGDMDDINPENIKSVDVLKDASALAYDPTAKNGVVLISTKSDKITSELDLRKFIAQRIKYPVEAQKANKAGIAQLFAKVNGDGIVYSISEKKVKDAIAVGEVVVTAYGPKPEEVVAADDSNDLSKLLTDEAKRVLQQIPKLDMPEFKGKTIAFTVKFMLQ
ncbi:carboxypeptidase-like regulatory domain-containing protein [Prolixibacteraceae bacterium Z1-6]|uniref:Carboxypeptidase-like regulatory domain-containing protein n=1 Tax=Draconibacterium aestuarii TaxID=2998507 RepID=A0A9X3F4S9_9BACT|nr:carboxypeptidase-like regulatory domain-containing protein [Prolixibacteraceae bacterium Z1-6]